MKKEIEIPEGYEARIEGNKVILEPKDSEDERTRKELMNFVAKVKDIAKSGRDSWAVRKEDVEMCERFLAYLEKQKYEYEVFEPVESTLEYKMGFKAGVESVRQKEHQPSEWSEEDELMRKRCIADFGYLTEYEPQYKERYDAQIDWLKSLLERFNLQPKQEWSEEDEQFLLVCKNALNKYQRSDHWDANIISNWLEERLKSLRPQSKNELSEEDERLLNIIIDILDREEHNGHLTHGNLKACVKLLKSLRPQHITYVLDAPLGYDKDLNPIYPPINHWKPTEKQIAALEWQIKNTSDGSWQRKESESLLTDLKKL